MDSGSGTDETGQMRMVRVVESDLSSNGELHGETTRLRVVHTTTDDGLGHPPPPDSESEESSSGDLWRRGVPASFGQQPARRRRSRTLPAAPLHLRLRAYLSETTMRFRCAAVTMALLVLLLALLPSALPAFLAVQRHTARAGPERLLFVGGSSEPREVRSFPPAGFVGTLPWDVRDAAAVKINSSAARIFSSDLVAMLTIHQKASGVWSVSGQSQLLGGLNFKPVVASVGDGSAIICDPMNRMTLDGGWSREAAELPTPFAEAGACVLGGSLYVLGVHVGTRPGWSFHRLSLAEGLDGEWETLTPPAALPTSPGPVHLAALHRRIYTTILRSYSSAVNDRAIVYSVEHDKWRDTSKVQPRVVSLGGELVVSSTGTGSLERLDQDTGRWSEIPDSTHHCSHDSVLIAL